MTYDLVIVGGGPAGASAAIFAGRAGLRTAVLDAGNGMAPKALVNNHLGLEAGVDGPELLARGRRQAEASGAEWIEDVVTSLTVENVPYSGGAAVSVATGGSVFIGDQLRIKPAFSPANSVQPLLDWRLDYDFHDGNALDSSATTYRLKQPDSCLLYTSPSPRD